MRQSPPPLAPVTRKPISVFSSHSLWRNRIFVLFWFGRTISLVGSTITAVVLPILLYQLTGSALQTALLTTLHVTPYLLFGLLAGAVADRIDRRRLMITCDVINTLLLASVPLAAWWGQLTITQIYLVEFLSACAFVWFDVANFGALPALVGRERVLEANSLLWSTGTLVEIVGPALGGLLAATLGAANALTLDAASYLCSAVALLLVGRTFNRVRTPQSSEGDSLVQQLRADISEGMRFLWQQRLVRALTLQGFGVSFTSGAVMSLVVVYAVRAMQIPQTDARIGFFYTASAGGALLSSLLLPWLVKRFAVGHITLAASFADLAMLIGLVLAPTWWLGLACYLAWSFCHTLIVINGISLRQMVTPEALLSRVNATARMIAWGGSPFGALVGGLLAESFDIRTTYLLVATGIALSAVLGWFSPLRQKELPLLMDSG